MLHNNQELISRTISPHFLVWRGRFAPASPSSWCQSVNVALSDLSDEGNTGSAAIWSSYVSPEGQRVCLILSTRLNESVSCSRVNQSLSGNSFETMKTCCLRPRVNKTSVKGSQNRACVPFSKINHLYPAEVMRLHFTRLTPHVKLICSDDLWWSAAAVSSRLFWFPHH